MTDPTRLSTPSRESRDLAMHRVNAHDYANVDEYIAAVDRLARYIEHGIIETPAQPHVTSSVTNVMNVR